MKKGLLATLLVSAGVLSLGLVPTNAHAEDQTDLEITINPDGGNKPGEDPLQNNLAIAWIPSSMNFGQQENTGKGVGTVKVFKDTLTEKPAYLAVSDDRTNDTGTLPKWRVIVKLSDFAVKGSTEATDKLANAQLEFKTGAVKDYELVKDSGNIISAPDPSAEGVLKPHNGNDITTTSDVKAVAGGSAVPVLTKAAPSSAKGAYATEITGRQLRVALPQGQAGKTFTAKLTWSLDNTFTGDNP